MKIIPKAQNAVVIEFDSGYSSRILKIEIRETFSELPSIQIILDKDANWKVNKTFGNLGDKNHIDVTLKGDKL